MAHFAQIDNNNVVLQVIVVHNNETHNADGIEDEILGIQFCKSLFGENTNWKQTSYNATIRKKYASVNYVYDELNDVFIPPKPFPSWMLNENFDWIPPTMYPQNGKNYIWDEQTISWKETLNTIPEE
jgi:hypothetical protein